MMKSCWWSLSVAALVGLLAVGCGGSSSADESGGGTSSSGSEATAATVVPNGQASVGDTTSCPVSGETFVVTADSPSVEHDGHTYYFCCPHCRERFQASPHEFLGEHGEQGEHSGPHHGEHHDEEHEGEGGAASAS